MARDEAAKGRAADAIALAPNATMGFTLHIVFVRGSGAVGGGVAEGGRATAEFFCFRGLGGMGHLRCFAGGTMSGGGILSNGRTG